MAEEVKRYDIYMHSDDVQFLREIEDGDYVRFTDYDAAVARAEKAEKRVALLEADYLNTGAAEQYDALTARVAALEAGLRKAIRRLDRYEHELPSANDDLRALLGDKP